MYNRNAEKGQKELIKTLVVFTETTRQRKQWLITQKLFWGPKPKKILYMPSERALKMLSFGSNIRCIRSRGSVGEQF